MNLYHGTDAKFRKPVLDKCLSYKDFGKGFYLTERLAMAKQWGERKNPVNYKVNLYEVEEDFLASAEREGMAVKRFVANAEWAEFVYNNREVEGYEHHYDVVTGPVANSKIESHFAKIKRGEATFVLGSSTYQRMLNDEHFRGESPLYIYQFLQKELNGKRSLVTAV